ncbi:GNAT family N-acetyltransferase [Streptomyces sp. WAC 00631]|uniref:GNAT family N-acetyltransferase n=1 Tax=Streptomyces sp. WAC 00631 TaxID=2203201 RepID=UPI00163CCCA5|nr:GNAT family N-acetyltransferase [Streptomyces sp. WAC 00631]MCC5032956.1 GNAT family N-acetyltransferase [Streptomyces sp. WAC 00631]
MQLRTVRLDHPDARKLNDRVQLEYTERYGDPDLTEMDPAQFDPPAGLYLIAYDPDGTPLATGGWRAQDHSPEGYRDGDAELKRMYVVPEARGRGLARRLLTVLEESAREAGRARMVLETGTKQPEAIALYTSCGYLPTAKFGYYRCEPNSRCFAKPLTVPAGPPDDDGPAAGLRHTAGAGPAAAEGR